MKNKATEFQELFNSTFSRDKIKNDLFFYLAENYNELNSTFNVTVYNEDSEISTSEIITTYDQINIISYRCIIQFVTDITFIVNIAIGDFKQDRKHNSFFEVNKCVASLKYNCNLEIIDVEFTINSINKM